MMVMKTLLAVLVPRYHVDAVAGDPAEPADYLDRMTFDIGSRMVGGTHVVMRPRHGTATANQRAGTAA